MGHSTFDPATRTGRAWNAGRVFGEKRASKPEHVCAIRVWLDHEGRLRDRALFDFAINSTLRGCDVVKVKIGDLVSGGRIRARTIVVQRRTKRPVQFELLEAARSSLLAWSRDVTERSMIMLSQAASITQPISARGSMPASSMSG